MSDHAPASSSYPLMTRLSVMMFLQYFAQGCYLPIASLYLQETLGFEPRQVGWFGSAVAVGPLLAPFLIGQLIDRMFPTQRVLAFCHLVSGVLMIVLYTQTGVWPVLILGTLYSVLYVPSMMLSNTMAFHHLKNREKEFPIIRLFGTLGFITPAWIIEFWWMRGLTGEELHEARGIAFMLSGIAGVAMGLYSMTLPHTSPAVSERRKYAPGAAAEMLRMRDVFVLVSVTFFIAIVHKFFFVWNSPFLSDVLGQLGEGWARYVQTFSSIGQVCELVVMAMLGFLVMRLGFKWTMTLGALAYMVRCLLLSGILATDLSFAATISLIAIAQALHGFCFGCFLAVAYMYVDRVSMADIRGSVQTLFGTFVIGSGFFVGGLISGWVGEQFTTDVGQGTLRESFGVAIENGLFLFETNEGAEQIRDWPGIWLASAALAAVCVIAFALFFPRDELGKEKVDEEEQVDETQKVEP